MSFAASVALQGAVYQHLRADPALLDLVGDAVFDAMPVEAPTGVYVSLGPEDVTDAGDMTAAGSRHDFVVSVLSGAAGRAGALPPSRPPPPPWPRRWTRRRWPWARGG